MYAPSRKFRAQAILAGAIMLAGLFAPPAAMGEAGPGIITVASRFGPGETVDRLKREIAARGIRLFGVVDQAALGREAGTTVRPSLLIMFGNPALGARFVELNPLAGLDWPVRVLVSQDDRGVVRVSYFNFATVAQRYGIAADDSAFKTATGVVASITAAIRAE